MCNLEPNVGQQMLWNTMNMQRDRDIPVRIVLLKPRQVGWSTWSCAEAFTEAYMNPFFNTGLFSLDDDSTDHIFRMIKLFSDELPPKMKRPLDATNRKEIVYSKPHRSRMLAQTAGKKGAGHSYTFRYVHCSEVTRWKDATTTMGGILQTVGKGAGTSVIIESTANGMGGYFYDLYWEAVKRLEADPTNIHGFLPVFFPWFKFPEYAEQIPPNFKLTEEETEEKAKHNLSDEQIMWRRYKLQEIAGDYAKFREEYPATALEAFQASGNPVFSRVILEEQKKRLVDDLEPVLFEREGETIHKVKVNRRENCWLIAYNPRRDSEYVIGIDTAEDKLSDETDPKSALDYDGAAVLDRASCEYVATWMGRTEGIDFAKQCYLAALYYNEAHVVPEIPKGMHVLRYFVNKQYPYIYSRTRREETGDPEETDLTTRRWLVEDFRTAAYERSIFVCCKPIYDQMETFVHDKTGKPIHMPSKHDDVLFAAFLALQGHLRMPKSSSHWPSETNSEKVLDKTTNLLYSGCIDTDDDEPDEDIWNYTS